ncbi:oxidoreductase [Trametes meyenii]|nr:oxidoreductase [Trametes meyenii]
MFGLLSKRWDPNGQHCFVTGGSSGTGLSLALLLVESGAHVSIVARNSERLAKALDKLESARQKSTQILKAYSFAVDSETTSAAALKAASEPHGGRCPGVLFLCAGASTPGFFVDQSEESLKAGMRQTYWAQAFTALAGTKEMVRQRVKGKIIFVSSVLAFFSIIGYAPYSPGKFALRGLAETLKSELKLYEISVHIAFPATIYTPGYQEENKTKPRITLKIEESDEGESAEAVAAAILKGRVQKGNFHITTGALGDVFRSSSAGASPRPNFLLDILYGFVGFVGLPFWRQSVDSAVTAHRSEHLQYLHAEGFLP